MAVIEPHLPTPDTMNSKVISKRAGASTHLMRVVIRTSSFSVFRFISETITLRLCRRWTSPYLVESRFYFLFLGVERGLEGRRAFVAEARMPHHGCALQDFLIVLTYPADKTSCMWEIASHRQNPEGGIIRLMPISA